MTRDEIKQLKENGALIVTAQTFNKNAEYNNTLLCGEVIYNGNKYTTDWLLTYGHKQYVKLNKISITKVRSI